MLGLRWELLLTTRLIAHLLALGGLRKISKPIPLTVPITTMLIKDATHPINQRSLTQRENLIEPVGDKMRETARQILGDRVEG